MHPDASCVAAQDHRHSDGCTPAKVICFPRRPKQPSTGSGYHPRTEYQDAYRAYSPDTIKNIYQENRKAMVRNREQMNGCSKESPKDLVPANTRVIAPKNRPVKPWAPPPKRIPPKKPHHKQKVPSPPPRRPPSPSSSSSTSSVSSSSSSSPPRHRPKPATHPDYRLPRIHWCTDVTCQHATLRAVSARRT